MLQSQTREEGHVDPVDGSFNILFLAQLRQYLACFAEVFPDQRLFSCFTQVVKGVMTAGVPIVTRITAAVHYGVAEKVYKQHCRVLEATYAGHP